MLTLITHLPVTLVSGGHNKRTGRSSLGGKGTLSGKGPGIKKISDCHALLLLWVSMYQQTDVLTLTYIFAIPAIPSFLGLALGRRRRRKRGERRGVGGDTRWQQQRWGGRGGGGKTGG